MFCFLENDKNSRILPGKDTVTRRKIKKQKRILNDTMKNLFKKFHSQNSDIKMFYPVFCTLRPYWIIPPDVKNRDMCLCTTPKNMALLVKKMKSLNMINQCSAQDVIQTLTCESHSESCLERLCPESQHTEIHFNDYEEQAEGKDVHKTKEAIKLKLEDFAFNESLTKFLQHCANIKHQHKVLDFVKKNPGEDELLIHIDFLENYCCKYTAEIQSAHFGGSKPRYTVSICVLSRYSISLTVSLLYHI
ncbi:hypothetical protein PR048_028218 [Dryococelus australis]|uniref:Uncharacterized protein n=1 Tax=Dryococelus australis TaxID=614101 RepID=A0ABQ9GIM7_9NEOP|nr:hypothetical protein PR048_028218 [Dryococelus australis]